MNGDSAWRYLVGVAARPGWRHTRRTPRNYARLLDCAANCVLLQKVGGGYTFRHRLLQEHFAGKLRQFRKNKEAFNPKMPQATSEK